MGHRSGKRGWAYGNSEHQAHAMARIELELAFRGLDCVKSAAKMRRWRRVTVPYQDFSDCGWTFVEESFWFLGS
jgi:hypothetical protein